MRYICTLLSVLFWPNIAVTVTSFQTVSVHFQFTAHEMRVSVVPTYLFYWNCRKIGEIIGPTREDLELHIKQSVQLSSSRGDFGVFFVVYSRKNEVWWQN